MSTINKRFCCVDLVVNCFCNMITSRFTIDINLKP